jgi:hypothetical protein
MERYEPGSPDTLYQVLEPNPQICVSRPRHIVRERRGQNRASHKILSQEFIPFHIHKDGGLISQSCLPRRFHQIMNGVGCAFSLACALICGCWLHHGWEGGTLVLSA